MKTQHLLWMFLGILLVVPLPATAENPSVGPAAASGDGDWVPFACPSANLVSISSDIKYDVKAGSEWELRGSGGSGGHWAGTQLVTVHLGKYDGKVYLECKYQGAGVTVGLRRALPKGEEFGQCLMSRSFPLGCRTRGGSPSGAICLANFKGGERPDTRGYAEVSGDRAYIECTAFVSAGYPCDLKCRP